MMMSQQLDILGKSFNSDNTCDNHAMCSIKKCRPNYYGVDDIGLRLEYGCKG